MVDLYNFLASWQLFPEKGTYELGNRPKSGIYRIGWGGNTKKLYISMNWVSFEDQAYESNYMVEPNGIDQTLHNTDLGDTIKSSIRDSVNFDIQFYKKGELVLEVQHHITPKGFLKITQRHHKDEEILLNDMKTLAPPGSYAMVRCRLKS